MIDEKIEDTAMNSAKDGVVTECSDSAVDESELKQRIIIRRCFGAALVIAGILVLALMLKYHTPRILRILETGNINDVEAYIRDEGTKGRYVLIFLQIIETVSIVLPALPVYICAGVLFGKLQGFLMCYITNIVMNILIFEFARKMKTRTEEFARIQQNKKLEKLMSMTDKPVLLVILMSILPVVPNGMIPYVCSQTTMKLKDFITGLSIGSFPAIFFYVCCGDFLLSEHYKKILPLIVVIVILLIIAALNKQRITDWIERVVRKDKSCQPQG